MSNITVVLNSPGIVEMLKSPEMKALLTERANAALSRLGNGYKTESVDFKERSGVRIAAETAEARKENSQNNTILKAIGG